MAESMFNIFGDSIGHNKTLKNIKRGPLFNNENIGKAILTGPVKPNEPARRTEKIGPIKPNELKKKSEKTFLSNKGLAFQSTPAKQPFTPRSVNLGTLIYHDTMRHNESLSILPDTESLSQREVCSIGPQTNFDTYCDSDDEPLTSCDLEEIAFTQPVYDKFHSDIELFPLSEKGLELDTTPSTPAHQAVAYNISFSPTHYESCDDLFSDNLSNESIIVNNLNLPDLY